MNQNFKNNGAWQQMLDIVKGNSIVTYHTVFNPVPYMISRCIGLSTGEKAVLIDIIGYMGNKVRCYPNIEALALNCGITHTIVEKHIKSLENKQLIVVIRRHSNSYILRSNFEANPYFVLSEILHKIRFAMKGSRNENERSQIEKIRKIVRSDIYTDAITTLLFICDFRLTHMGGADSWLEMYRDTLVKFIDAVHKELKVEYEFSHIFRERKEFYKHILNEEQLLVAESATRGKLEMAIKNLVNKYNLIYPLKASK